MQNQFANELVQVVLLQFKALMWLQHLRVTHVERLAVDVDAKPQTMSQDVVVEYAVDVEDDLLAANRVK